MELLFSFVFTLVSVVVLFASILAAIGFYHLVKQLLINGTIDNSFIITGNKDIQYLLLFIEYNTTMLGRFGVSSFNSYTLKKIRLQNRSLEYEVVICRFGADFLRGFISVIGVNDEYAFIWTYGDDLVVVDHKRGKKRCNRKKIEAKNPGLKGFKAELCKYDNTRKSVVIYDSKKNGHLLNVETIIAKPIRPAVNSKAGGGRKPLEFSDLPSVQLSGYYLGVWGPNSFSTDSLKNNGSIVSDKGSKRYYVNVYGGCSGEKWGDESKTFLNPKIMQPDKHSNITYLATKPRSIIVVHSADMKPKIGDINVSRVSGRSEEEWKLAITTIAARPRLSEDSLLYFVEAGNELYFIYIKGRIISVSTVDKISGSVIGKPALFVHRRIYGILSMRGFL